MKMQIGCKILAFSCEINVNSSFNLAKSFKFDVNNKQLIYILYIFHLRKIEYETEKKCKVLSSFASH
jgi:hypothetical protein